MSIKYTIAPNPRRKNYCLKVVEQQVIVQTPKRYSKFLVDVLIEKNKNWISSKISEQKTHLVPCPLEAKQITILDKHYRIEFNTGERLSTTIRDNLIIICTPNGDLAQQKAALNELVNKLLLDYISNELLPLATQLNANVSSVKVRYYKSRWGACARGGKMSFNTLLAFAPKAVLDYVIVHEACHLIEMNHSKAFWDLVAQYSENYKLLDKWLRVNGKHLRAIK